MAESPAERNTRLIKQIAVARAAQAEKRKHAHVCPPSELDQVFAKLMRRMAKYAPNNMARMPIAISQDGGVWYVDLHVWIKGVIEYSIEGIGETMCDALANASKCLARQYDIKQDALRDGQIFHITY